MHIHAMCVVTMNLPLSSTLYTIECTRTTHTHLLRHVQNESDLNCLLGFQNVSAQNFKDLDIPSATANSIYRRFTQQVAQTHMFQRYIQASAKMQMTR